MLVPRVVPLQVQDFALPLCELHEVPGTPFLCPVQVPLGAAQPSGTSAFPPSICVISKFAEGMLGLIIQIANEQYNSLCQKYEIMTWAHREL